MNPFASQLTFMSDKTRTRRDHMKYLTLIQAIALLHQYQREIKRVEHRGQVVEYIEVAREDIAPPTVWHMKYSGAPRMKCRRRRANC